jgi:hypothetical protein
MASFDASELSLNFVIHSPVSTPDPYTICVAKASKVQTPGVADIARGPRLSVDSEFATQEQVQHL